MDLAHHVLVKFPAHVGSRHLISWLRGNRCHLCDRLDQRIPGQMRARKRERFGGGNEIPDNGYWTGGIDGQSRQHHGAGHLLQGAMSVSVYVPIVASSR
jgi:hypothetical protein